MTKRTFIPFTCLFLLVFGCTEKQDVDLEKPIVNTEYKDAFPSYCDTIYFGEPFNFNAYFTDNAELGAYSIDIHNNFDHHSHGFKIDECKLDLKKELDDLNPFSFIENFEIPDSLTQFTANQAIEIPFGNEKGDYESGDYHFQIYLTDKEGWSTAIGLSVKMMHRME